MGSLSDISLATGRSATTAPAPIQDLLRLAGKTAIVTGGAIGIGYRIAIDWPRPVQMWSSPIWMARRPRTRQEALEIKPAKCPTGAGSARW